jgi:hypothetical protein
MQNSDSIPPPGAPLEACIPFLEQPWRLGLVLALILACYLGFAFATLRANRVDADESAFANPAYNLIHHGFMGTTIYGEHGLMPTASLMRHTYWTPPLFMLSNAVVFRVFGMGVSQVRATSIFWGLIALFAWYVFLRTGSNSPAMSLLVTGFISLGYFFQLAAANGRMDMMCLALGTAGLAVYRALREWNLPLAMLASNGLVAASGLTHAVGLMYFGGLLFLTLRLDRKNLRIRHLALAAIPYLVGAAGWGAYISQDPEGFREQMRGNVEVTSAAAGLQPGFVPLQMLKLEVARRYRGPFGLGPGVPLANRAKAVVLIAYLSGIVGILLIGKLRRDPFLIDLVILAAIDFSVLAFIATSKNSYYLPHTTAVFSAILALVLLRAPVPGSRWQIFGIATLAALTMVQLAGLAMRNRVDEFHTSYQPAIRAIRANSQPGSLIYGPAELWLGLAPDRELIHDWTLGYQTGRKAALVVTSPLLREVMAQAAQERSEKFDRAAGILAGSQKIYEDSYYVIYRPQAQ